MPTLERTIEVRWRHQVHFTHDVFSLENALLADVLVDGRPVPFGRRAKALVVVDEALAQAAPGLVARIEAWFAARADSSLLVCPPVLIIGGGALLDMVGLAAATAHRGVRLVRLPTTTLAQDDSGVGVKNGINAFGKKNFVGTFTPPFAVINDFKLLETLPPRDKRAGYVEAVKVACIRDAAFFARMEQDVVALAAFEPAAMQRLIFRSAELHLDHIAGNGDPFEMGSARPLDFGHWAAHKLEQLSEYRLRHGEAVADGVALDVVYARSRGFLGAADAERVLVLLERLGFDLFAGELLHEDETGQLRVVAGLEEFREHLGGELTITLLRAIGQGFEVHEMSQPLVVDAIDELQRRHLARGGSLLRLMA